MFMKLLEEHPGTFIGLIVGIFVGLLFLTVGFWKTLIFSSIVGIGFYIGKKYDNREDLKEILEKVLPDNFFR